MTYTTPRTLNSLAAETLVEDLILESPIFLNFHCNRSTGTLQNPSFGLNQISNDINENIQDMEDAVKGILRKCDKGALESIRHILRTTDHYCSSGSIMLQFFYDTELYFRQKHWSIFQVVKHMDRKFPQIEKLVIDKSENVIAAAELIKLFQLLPNLKVFKASIYQEKTCLEALQKHCPKLVELSLYLNADFLHSNILCELFFAGSTMNKVRSSYVTLEESIKLSFPRLETFSMKEISIEQFDFFKMFFHFYPKVNFWVGHSTQHMSCGVSWFDAVLSHSVVINPGLRVRQCNLVTGDLLLPFCSKSLSKWKNLECLVLTVGLLRSTSHCEAVGKRLEAVLRRQINISDLTVRVLGSLQEEQMAQMLHPALQAFGDRLRQLKLIGMQHFVTHRALVQLVNLCPNLQRLDIMGKRISKYIKGLHPIQLVKLTSLNVSWAEQENATYAEFVSRVSSDLIRAAPNVTSLYITANLSLLETLTKAAPPAAPKLRLLTIYFYTEKSCGGLEYLRRLLPRFPALRELVVKESQYERTCGCQQDSQDDDCICDQLVDSIYSAMKRWVANTRVDMRYFTVEDAQLLL